MNPDGTFCLGLNAGHSILDSASAEAWWNKLGVFLTCQDTAHETRDWPPKIQISHGRAGETEIYGENIAEELGLLEEFQLAVREDRGPIADAAKKIRKSTGHLINGRTACVCGRTDKRGYIKLRRECRKANDACLPLIEAQRRLEEKYFWRALAGKHACCGTMNTCPLK
jgi:hypothetical protein